MALGKAARTKGQTRKGGGDKLKGAYSAATSASQGIFANLAAQMGQTERVGAGEMAKAQRGLTGLSRNARSISRQLRNQQNRVASDYGGLFSGAVTSAFKGSRLAGAAGEIVAQAARQQGNAIGAAGNLAYDIAQQGAAAMASAAQYETASALRAAERAKMQQEDQAQNKNLQSAEQVLLDHAQSAGFGPQQAHAMMNALVLQYNLGPQAQKELSDYLGTLYQNGQSTVAVGPTDQFGQPIATDIKSDPQDMLAIKQAVIAAALGQPDPHGNTYASPQDIKDKFLALETNSDGSMKVPQSYIDSAMSYIDELWSNVKPAVDSATAAMGGGGVTPPTKPATARVQGDFISGPVPTGA